MKYEKITWLDHFSESEWKDLKEVEEWAEERAQHPCVSTGTVVYETDILLVVSMTFDGEENYGDHMAIFKNCIIKREEIDVI